jgi:hypothetical protein
MRAVKTVISAAGNIKREYPDLDEVKYDLRVKVSVMLKFMYLMN